ARAKAAIRPANMPITVIGRVCANASRSRSWACAETGDRNRYWMTPHGVLPSMSGTDSALMNPHHSNSGSAIEPSAIAAPVHLVSELAAGSGTEVVIVKALDAPVTRAAM